MDYKKRFFPVLHLMKSYMLLVLLLVSATIAIFIIDSKPFDFLSRQCLIVVGSGIAVISFQTRNLQENKENKIYLGFGILYGTVSVLTICQVSVFFVGDECYSSRNVNTSLQLRWLYRVLESFGLCLLVPFLYSDTKKQNFAVFGTIALSGFGLVIGFITLISDLWLPFLSSSSSSSSSSKSSLTSLSFLADKFLLFPWSLLLVETSYKFYFMPKLSAAGFSHLFIFSLLRFGATVSLQFRDSNTIFVPWHNILLNFAAVYFLYSFVLSTTLLRPHAIIDGNLQNTIMELHHAMHSKAMLFACMSHELRNPLNGIIGMLQILRDISTTFEQNKLIKTMTSASDCLLVVINDMLDFFKIESGKLVLEHVPVSLKEVARSVLDMMRPKALEKGVELIFHAATLPNVLGDRTRLYQVLTNLVSNSIKFTSNGGSVTIQITEEEVHHHRDEYENEFGLRSLHLRKQQQKQQEKEEMDDDNAIRLSTADLNILCDLRNNNHNHNNNKKKIATTNNTNAFNLSGSSSGGGDDNFPRTIKLFFEIIDTGYGMTEDQLRNVFKPFCQADVSTTRLHGGTGLGLTIVEKLVDLMGGKVEVRSEIDVGTTFYFTLNLQQTTSVSDFHVEPPLRLRDSDDVDVNLNSLSHEHHLFSLCFHNWLVVDDSDINRTVMEIMADRLNCIVTSVECGERAIELMRLLLLSPATCDINAVHQPPEDLIVSFDIIFMDLHMLGIDGIETTRQLKQMGIKIPIVGITGDVLESTISECLASGMVAVLQKPIRIDSLKKILLDMPKNSVN